MVHRKGLVRAAAFAALACTGIARAETSVPSNDGLSITPLLLDAAPASAPAAPATAPATPPTPLMGALAGSFAGTWLDSWGIHIGGYVEGGYTYEGGSPPGNVITGRTFDTKHERVVLDQADLAISRAVDYAAAAKDHRIDIGATFEAIYGWDSGLIHSDGLYDNPSNHQSAKGAYYSSRTQPENQFDINQAYVDIAIPIGTGLRLRVGKEVTPNGQEVINPTGNALYSHSYLFGFAIPFTNTGVFGEYKLNDDWLFDVGVSRGWNQSLLDNNSEVDFLASATWTPQGSDEMKKWKVIVNTEVGPEATKDNHDWWTLIDFIATYAASDKLSFALNADFGDAPHGLGTTSGIWYGAAAYASYVVNPMFTANLRAEAYQDVHGFTLGGALGTLTVYEATLGVKITPFPDNAVLSNLAIRPEVRVDYADKAFFNGATDHFQFTAGLDAYFIY
jgi:hypothetical protein